MLTDEILIENGYKKFKDNYYNYEVRLVTDKEKYGLNILMYCIKDMALEEIEREVYAIWYGLDCKCYGE